MHTHTPASQSLPDNEDRVLDQTSEVS